MVAERNEFSLPLLFIVVAIILIAMLTFVFLGKKNKQVKNKNSINWSDPNSVFSNNGEKIKNFAKGLYRFCYAIYMLTGFIYIGVSFSDFENLWWMIFVGAIVIALAGPLAYLSTYFIHGFGELVSNSYGNSNIGKIVEKEKESAQQQYACYSCGKMVNSDDTNCKNCGAPFSWNNK